MSISGFLGRVGVLLAINFLGAITGVAIATGVCCEIATVVNA